MIVLTDSVAFAENLLGGPANWKKVDYFPQNPPLRTLAERLFPSGSLFSAKIRSDQYWQYCFYVEQAAESQFDLLAEPSLESRNLPHGILCCAGSGTGFHGQNNRPWITLPGNVHLTTFFRPQRKLANCGIAFTVLGVVSVLQVIDELGISGAQVKWVNDILIGRAKIGGVLVNIKTEGESVSAALLGIGLNVEKTPKVEPDPFVPKVGSLRDFSDNSLLCTQSEVLRRLAAMLTTNYRRLMTGQLTELLNVYRKRSVIQGNTVTIYEDQDDTIRKEMGSGRVLSIGDNLELTLEGVESPVWRGRLVLGRPE